MVTATTDYTSENIEIKQGIEHVRARPAMYIGDIYDKGLHHLISEVVDNSVDEAMAGHCTQIDVTISDDGAISIMDNGRGIPVGIHPKMGKPTVEVCLTELGAGGKFSKDSYKVSGGLHGVGVSCVNALAEWLEAEVYREGKTHRIRFERGVTTEPLEVVGKTERRGTKITFLPDSQIFKASIEFKYATIAARLKELAYLNAGLKIVLTDERDEDEVRSETFHFPEGIRDFVNELGGSDELLLSKPIYLKGTEDSVDSGGQVEVEIAIQYNDTYSPTIVSYTNNINTIEGGTHLTGFRTALTSTLNTWIKDNPDQARMKESERPSGDDYREGLVAVVSVKVPEPQFEGQTKTKLGNSDVAGIVQAVLGSYLKNWCEQNPGLTKKIVRKAAEARKVRLAAKKAKDMARKRKDVLTGGGIPKLKDCESRNPEECEIYLVEGDSAGGTAGEARDTMTQAILPLRGKILNVWKATHDRMLNHNEISTIIQALGTSILDDFNIERLKYHKVVIMCDADVDGSHIRTLILTFFFRQMPELIEQGKIYVAQPPLFKITYKGVKEEYVDDKGKTRKKDKEEYFLNDSTFQTAMLRLGLDGTELKRLVGQDNLLEGEGLASFAEVMEAVVKARDEVAKKLRSSKGTNARLSRNDLLRRYLSRSKEGKLPYARIQASGKKAPAVYSEQQLEDWLRAALEAEPELKVWRQGEPLSERATSDVQITLFRKPKKALEKALETLTSMGLTFEDLLPPIVEQGGEKPDPAFRLVRGKDELGVDGLIELTKRLRDMAAKSVDVQRYKGLGEMDADELEETTMDPAKRILKLVTMESTAQANEIFSKLMGSKVEPRREFIERHALDVRDLDA
ncbi:MAG TPA: DNA gyrase subunit B [Planctomycetes bacterium]|nr:DNA gyrase subunit B [Planctomycetota bacterium]